jgi:hypothetical protein
MMESNNDNNNKGSGGGGSSSSSSSSSSSNNNLINDNNNFILSNNIEESFRKNRPGFVLLANNIEERYRKRAGPVDLINFSYDDVDKILVNEMNNCSINDRTAIQEEIHCVFCLALDETPLLLKRSLKQLSIELDNDDHIPVHEKHAYILSQRLQKEQQEQQQQLLYVNSIEFRLMYLRCQLFDVKKAAKSIVQALDWLLKHFGEYALERKIKLSDFTKTELSIMRKGFIQLLQSREYCTVSSLFTSYFVSFIVSFICFCFRLLFSYCISTEV